jgi:Restriction alleviation protein Lar
MELYPCPFCGGEAVVGVRHDPWRHCQWFWVLCGICKVGQPQSQYTVLETAETDWNDRCDQLLVTFPTRVRTVGS